MDWRTTERLTMLPSQRMEFSTSEARIFEPGRNRAWVKMGCFSTNFRFCRTALSYDPFAAWRTGEKLRKDGYREFKTRLARGLVETADHVLPGLLSLIDVMEAAWGLIGEIPAMAKSGVNLLVCEIDYNDEFISHPELRHDDPVTKDMVKERVRLCRRHKIRLVPQFQFLGHQSWAEKMWPLLTKYPQFDETPGKYPGNKDGDKEFYCRNWRPLHPDLYPIIFSLYDELLDVFEADALHVGMDEVFLIGDKDCPRCAGKDPAELFAHAVNTAYDHLVKEKDVEMFIWADRFLDGEATGYGEWEASMNKTYPASFRDTKAVKMLIDDSFKYSSERVLGHMCTSWGGVEPDKIAKCDQFKTIAKELRKYGLLTTK